jgi:hypothetical protein
MTSRSSPPPNPNLPITPKFQQKLFLMTTVGNMPHISGSEVSVSHRHGVRPLKLLFSPQKTPSKAQKQHKFQLFSMK